MRTVLTTSGPPTAFLKLLRPHQWTKSGFVLTGLLFVPDVWKDLPLVLSVLALAVAFALTASGVYILNDLADVERDRAHPTKRHRPIAAGTVSRRAAQVLMALCWLTGFALALPQGWTAALLLLVYLLLNVAYSAGLKHEIILDVFIVAAGFVLRVLMGTLAVGIAPSQWLILTSGTFALFLGFTKRRAEWQRFESGMMGTRNNLERYSPGLLDLAVTLTATSTFLMYTLYTVSADTAHRHGTGNLVVTVPIVLYGLLHFLNTVRREHLGDPSDVLIRDRRLQITVLVWVLTTAVVLAWS